MRVQGRPEDSPRIACDCRVKRIRKWSLNLAFLDLYGLEEKLSKTISHVQSCQYMHDQINCRILCIKCSNSAKISKNVLQFISFLSIRKHLEIEVNCFYLIEYPNDAMTSRSDYGSGMMIDFFSMIWSAFLVKSKCF